MKHSKILVVLIALLFVTQGNAQLWKRLKKGVTKTIKDIAKDETDKTLDSIFGTDDDPINNSDLKVEDTYTFTHQYDMQIITGSDTVDMSYYLTNANAYMGSTFDIGNQNESYITVIDLPNSAIHIFMDLGSQKTKTSMKIDLEDIDHEQKDSSDFTISATGQTKEIIGYQCEEYQVTGPKLSGTVWITNAANISFKSAFSQLNSKSIKGLKGLDQSWMSMVDGLVLETTMTDFTKRKPKTIKMICTSLLEKHIDIKTLNYKNPF